MIFFIFLIFLIFLIYLLGKVNIWSDLLKEILISLSKWSVGLEQARGEPTAPSDQSLWGYRDLGVQDFVLFSLFDVFDLFDLFARQSVHLVRFT